MKVLYCGWYENSVDDTINNLGKIAEEVILIQRNVKEYLGGSAISEVADKLADDVDVVFSYDFLPLVSKVCREKGKKYISWIYDWPNYTVFDPEVYNDCNEIYLFEKDGINRLEKYRVKNLHYMPLAVDVERLDGQLGRDIENTEFIYDVSFVGNLYLKKEEAMMTENIPEYYSGFVDAIASVQEKIFGYNLVNDIVDREFAAKYFTEISTSVDGSNVPREYVLATQVNKLVTGQERRRLLTEAACCNDVHLFTGKVSEDLGNVHIHGTVDYQKEMPEVFRKSKINLNITLRSITSGVPLRVFDILGAGGFCLTNYQEGIMEHFEDGKDLVMYTSKEDMLEKIQYYLKHNDERIRIACNGHESVKKYSYDNAFAKMFMSL